MNPKAYSEVYDAMDKHAWDLYKYVMNGPDEYFVDTSILRRIEYLKGERKAKYAIMWLSDIMSDCIDRISFTNIPKNIRNHYYWVSRHASHAMVNITNGYTGKCLCPHPELGKLFED